MYRVRPSRAYAPAPVAALALTVLAVHWCASPARRIVFLSLLAAGLAAQLTWTEVPPLPHLDMRLPGIPTVSATATLQALRALRPPAWMALRLRTWWNEGIAPPETLADAPPITALTDQPVVLPAREEPSPAAAEPVQEPLAAVAPPPAEVPAAPLRAPWQAPNRATAPFPTAIERWRPLVRQLIGEAWLEGRLDGAAATIDDDFVLAMIQQESLGDPDALSRVGAIGLMQVMPFTFADVMAGDRSLTCDIDRAAMWDAPSNVRAGIRYLALAMQAFDGNRYWALAAYNAGIDTVRDFREAGLYAVPPSGGYTETANYASVILSNYLRRRPDVAMYVPDRMPAAHVPGALRLLTEEEDRRGGPRAQEWIPTCG